MNCHSPDAEVAAGAAASGADDQIGVVPPIEVPDIGGTEPPPDGAGEPPMSPGEPADYRDDPPPPLDPDE